MTAPTKPTPKSIVVTGRRWFQRTYGNTYHSCQIIVDGVSIEGIEFVYGYGDHYLTNAAAKLEEQGYIYRERYEASGGMESLWQVCERMGITLNYSATDVSRKKDL